MSKLIIGGDAYTFETADGAIFYEVIEPTKSSVTSPTTLTLLHNFMSTGRTAWGTMLAKFAEEYRILLPDLPGHGKSIGYPAGFHHGKIANQLAALLIHEQATTGHLAGCSAGGMIAQLLVAKENITPQTLTLISTTYSIHETVVGATQALKPENFRAGHRWQEATARLHDPYRYPGYYEETILPAFRHLDPSTAIDLPLSTVAVW